MTSRSDHDTRLALFATLLVAAVLVVMSGLQRIAPAARVIGHHAGGAAQSCHAVVAAIACTAYEDCAPAARAFAPSRHAWIGDSSICVSDPLPSSIGSVVRAGVALTHDATGPPVSLQA